jgi:hypothetical protein
MACVTRDATAEPLQLPKSWRYIIGNDSIVLRFE